MSDAQLNLGKLLTELDIQQADLARRIDVTQASMSRWISGDRGIPPVACLCLAALARNPELKEFWMTHSKVSSIHRKFIMEALSGHAATATDAGADWHDKLTVVLTDGDEGDKIGIQRNLEWAVTAIQSRPPKRKAAG